MADSQDRYVNSTDGLNLRATAGGSVLITLAHGTRLKAIGQPTAPDAKGIRWQQVQTDNGQTGWVAAQYLSATNPAAPAAAQAPAPAAPPRYVYVNSADGLNLRADKSSSAKVIVTLANGQRLRSLEAKSGPDARGMTWLSVKTDDGQEGWVAAQYVADQPPAAPKTISIPTTTAVNAADIAAEILRRTNDLRQQHQVSPVALNDTLSRVALAHSEYMAQNGISHTGAGGLSGKQRIINAGFGAGRPMENIYGGQASIDDAWDYWVNDPPHREVLLSPYNTVVGIGVYQVGRQTYYTMDFGKPA
jgi:uncharacterized protein YkwD